jgi:hypothetical protein
MVHNVAAAKLVPASKRLHAYLSGEVLASPPVQNSLDNESKKGPTLRGTSLFTQDVKVFVS